MATVTEKFYNPEVKEKYLNSIENENTRYVTMYPFITAKKQEEQLKKDIYEMNIDELALVMGDQKASSIDAAYVNASRFEQYINWAIENGLLPNNLNPITNLPDKREWAAQFVSTYRQSVFTRKELLEMCKDLANDVDKAVLIALFEGIAGKGYAELLNLQTKHLKEVAKDKYTAQLFDADGSDRTINISKELYKLLLAADSQPEYFNKNGQAENERSSISKFEDSPYIFKKTTRGKQGGKLNNFFVLRKMEMFKEIFELKYLKAKHIADSGMMHMANEMYNSKGELTVEDMREIAVHYNTSIVIYKGEEQRRTIDVKKVLSTDLFKNLYGYEIV